MTKWIKCSERLPENDRWVLIYSKHKTHLEVGHYSESYFSPEEKRWSVSFPKWVSHWCELPEPPENE